ncbi:unnamed protein product [Linum tenue]|uniref:CCHC-type domain-containing protein n=1 Tax=Linum tenue TaxID=586396 RepID=A0AAV0R1I8_9ROSI|nr:unnamed protein product [Linum tenue]
MVQLPALKIHFYHKEILTTLGNLIGRTIKLDYHMLNRQRAKFARLAVEVDLAKHLVPRIWLDDAWQKVEYENLPAVYFECGKIGHDAVECPKILKNSPPATLAITGPATTTETAEQLVDEPNPGFGPWMLVSRKSRRNQRDLEKKGKSETDARHPNQGNQAILGKGGSYNKERISPSPAPSSPLKISQQRFSSQEKKAGNGKKKVEEGKKGKAIMISETADNSASILGPGPSRNPTPNPVPAAGHETNRATSSAHFPMSPTHANKTKSKSKEELGLRASPLPQPNLHTVIGPNGTIMQIVEVPPTAAPPPPPPGKKNLHDSPSTATRTKRNKKQKAQLQKSPFRFPPMKSLQIWTPKKEKKAKSRVRIATLTLQEINAWTSAAKLSTGISGDSPPADPPEGFSPTPPPRRRALHLSPLDLLFVFSSPSSFF